MANRTGIVLVLALFTILLTSTMVTALAIRVDITGDVSGTTTRDALKKRAQNFVFVLGDLGYQSSLSWFKTNYGDVFGSKLKCVLGNHDSSNEDGSSTLQNQAIAFCGSTWFIKVGPTLFMAWNSNGNVNTQLGFFQNLVMNSTFMHGINNTVLLSHKPCYTHPNSHHPAMENSGIKTFCNSLISKIPTNVTQIFVAGHNHEKAGTADGTKFISGGGGKGAYTCGTSSTWTFCKTTKGFLELDIRGNGTIYKKFFDTSGKVEYSK